MTCMCSGCVMRRSGDPVMVGPPRFGAAKRGNELLLAHLNKTQRRTWKDNQYFDVNGSDGNVYRIHRHESDNIEMRGSHRRLWVMPTIPMVDGDRFLQQKLYLESDAIEVRRISCS